MLIVIKTIKTKRQFRWSSAFNTKFRYDSRDLFPVGWCQRAGFPLQTPPKIKKRQSSLSTSFFSYYCASYQISDGQKLSLDTSNSHRDSPASSSPSDRLYIDVDMPVLSPNHFGSKGSGDSATGTTTDETFQPDGFFSRMETEFSADSDNRKLTSSLKNGHSRWDFN